MKLVGLIPPPFLFFLCPAESFRSPSNYGFLKGLAVLLFGLGVLGFHMLSWKHCQNCPPIVLVIPSLAGEQASCCLLTTWDMCPGFACSSVFGRLLTLFFLL